MPKFRKPVPAAPRVATEDVPANEKTSFSTLKFSSFISLVHFPFLGNKECFKPFCGKEAGRKRRNVMFVGNPLLASVLFYFASF